MIKSFEHKGLEKFFTRGIKSGIQASHAVKLNDQLTALHTSSNVADMDIPGWRLHQLKGNKKNFWSIVVSKNWHLVFKFKDGHAYIVNYDDDH